MDTESGAGFSPFKDFYRVKVTRFPDGGGEAVCFSHSVFQEDSASLAAKAKRCANGGDYLRTQRQEAIPENQRAAKDAMNVERSARRAAKAVRHFVRRLSADHLLTVTYRENMQDLDRGRRDWKAFVEMVKSRIPEWRYVVVSEYQERGALHFHAAVRGYQNVAWLRRCWWRVVGEGMGNIDVKGPPKRFAEGGKTWRASKLSGYLTKYMAKGFAESVAHSKRYWASRDLPKLKVTAWYLEAQTMQEAITQTYSIVASGRVEGVRQWIDDCATCYWVSSELPAACPW